MTVFLLARGYPTLHLAMIFDEGLVYDFSVKDKCQSAGCKSIDETTKI